MKDEYKNLKIFANELKKISFLCNDDMREFAREGYGYFVKYITKMEKPEECASSLGASVFIDGEKIPLNSEFYRDENNNKIEFDFIRFSNEVLKIEFGYNEWQWCFSDKWVKIDNTPKSTSKRIMELVNNGLPNNWDKQMKGEAPFLLTDMIFYSYKNAYIFDNEGKQVRKITRNAEYKSHSLVVGDRGDFPSYGLFLNLFDNNIYSITAYYTDSYINRTEVGEVFGTIKDLVLVSTKQAIDILKNNKPTIFNNKSFLKKGVKDE